MAPGISFVICSFNGAERLGPTIAHLAAQRFRDDVPREVVLVDNASTDDTFELVARLLPADLRMPLRRLREPVPGVGYARARGLREAVYDYVLFVDDDNWLAPDFGQVAFDLMESDPGIGLLPARSEAVFGGPKPPWFDPWQRAFAVGAQFEQVGDVTYAAGHWWTAGLTVRRAAWADLIAHGFAPRLRGRAGRHLGGGEDTELCLALLMAGWRAHADPRLEFKHWMPSERLTWDYVRRLAWEGQGPIPTIAAYRLVWAERRGVAPPHGVTPSWTRNMARQAVRALLLAPRAGRELWRGKPAALVQLRTLRLAAYVAATARSRGVFEALVADLRQARWVGDGPARVRAATHAR